MQVWLHARRERNDPQRDRGLRRFAFARCRIARQRAGFFGTTSASRRPTERIAHVGTAGECCNAGVEPAYDRLGSKPEPHPNGRMSGSLGCGH
jgi:hypothetical protein